MKSFILLLLSISTLFGTTTLQKLKFESGISFYGTVGFVDMVFQEDTQKHTYSMEVKTYSTGLVKLLSQDRRDRFVSKGKIIKGIYRPDTFTQTTTKNGYKQVTQYSFDYTNNTVHKKVEKERHFMSKSFDTKSFSFKEIPQTTTKITTKELPLVANDYFTLYLNVMHNNITKGKIAYIDQNEKDTLMLINHNLFEVQKDNGKEKYQIILKEDKNSIFFKEALSLDVAFYGDAYIRKTWESIKH